MRETGKILQLLLHPAKPHIGQINSILPLEFVNSEKMCELDCLAEKEGLLLGSGSVSFAW